MSTRKDYLLGTTMVAGAAGNGVGRKAFSDQVLGVTVSAFQFD